MARGEPHPERPRTYVLRPDDPGPHWDLEGRHLFRFGDGTERWMRVTTVPGEDHVEVSAD